MAVAVEQKPTGSAAIRPLRALNKRILDLFVVDPSTGHALGYIDGLRAIAVLMVVFLHGYDAGTVRGRLPSGIIGVPLTPWHVDVAPILNHGGMGVRLFFVLSGFLLAQSWLKASYTGAPRPSIYTYFKLRVFRLVPAYYVCLFLTLLFFTPVFIPAALVYSHDGLLILLSHLIFVQFLVPIASTSYNFDGVLWTLTIEALFYVTLPLIIHFFYRKRWMIALPVAVAIQIGWLYACQHYFGGLAQLVQASVAHNPYILPHFNPAESLLFLQMQYPRHIADFALGITCCNFYTRLRVGLPRGRVIRTLTAPWAGVIYFALGWTIMLLYMYTTPLPDGTDYAPWWNANPALFATLTYYFSEVVAALACTLVLAGLCFGFTGMRLAFSVLPLRLIGIISYSIYLWHVPLIFVIVHNPAIGALSPTDRFHSVLLLDLLLVLSLSAFMYLAVEQPFIRYARTRARAKPDAVQGAPPLAMPVRFPRIEDIVEAPTETHVPALHLSQLSPANLPAMDLSQVPTAELPAMPAADSGPLPGGHSGHGRRGGHGDGSQRA